MHFSELEALNTRPAAAVAHLSYAHILELLKAELDRAEVAFASEVAAIRAGTLDRQGPRPGEDAFRHALARFSKCLLDGVVPSEFIG